MAGVIRCRNCGGSIRVDQSLPESCSSCGAFLDLVIDLTKDPAPETSVLIIDDEPHVRRAVAIVLRGDGFETVLEAPSGPDGVFIAQQHRPVFVLLDHRMPAIGGKETAKLLRTAAPSSTIVSFSLLDDMPAWADAHLAKEDMGDTPDFLRLLNAYQRAGVRPER